MIFVQSLVLSISTYKKGVCTVEYVTLTQCHILHSEDDDDVGRDTIMVPRSSCLSEDTTLSAKTLGSYHMLHMYVGH